MGNWKVIRAWEETIPETGHVSKLLNQREQGNCHRFIPNSGAPQLPPTIKSTDHMNKKVEKNLKPVIDSKTNELKHELWITGPPVSCVLVEANYPAAKINTSCGMPLLLSLSLCH